jgi:CheY-like chemotaxis protein
VLVDIDTVRMEQVMTNLLVNAVKYSPRGSHIRVSVQRDEGEALLSVEDEGVGVSAEMLPRIFDAFTQVDSSLDRARGGLGLGLTVVRGIVELHGGSVRALSEGLGRGTRFEIRLPLAPALRMAPATEAAPRPSVAVSHPRCVLIVEDDADIRETLQETLEDEGHIVRTAPDGAAAIAQARVARPEVALVDIGLPGMTGYDLARTLRAEFGAAIYLAAMTGYGLPVDRERAHEAGFDVHLTKPVDVEKLGQLVRQVPERPRIERANEAPASRA